MIAEQVAPAPESMTYVGRNPCGCVGALVVDDGDRPAIARDVGDMVRRGMAVERVATAVIQRRELDLSACADNPACVRRSASPRPRVSQAPLL